MKDIRSQLENQHTEYEGDYRTFAILDESCAVLLGIEYTIAMARVRIAKKRAAGYFRSVRVCDCMEMYITV